MRELDADTGVRTDPSNFERGMIKKNKGDETKCLERFSIRLKEILKIYDPCSIPEGHDDLGKKQFL